jgi:tRNA dimethylallyltransferase
LDAGAKQIEMPELPPLIVICGATATGKTALSIELSRQFDGEVINADSRYFYRGMDIGVAKPSMAERRGVPHHLIDILDLDDPEGMSLAVFQGLAFAAIDDVLARGKLPFLTGGTPLYINAVVENWRIPAVPPNEEFRARLAQEIETNGLDLVVERLRAVDSVAAERSGSNPRRVIRALEIYESIGKPMSEIEGKDPPRYQSLELGLSMPRERLYRAIDDRVDDQIARGLEREVRTLLESGIPRANPAFSALGYRQLFPVIDGEVSLEDAIRTIKHDTHRYVRHQETWLRKNARIDWLDVTMQRWQQEAAESVEAFLGKIARH